MSKCSVTEVYPEEIEEIPKPLTQRLESLAMTCQSTVVFDLETTSLERDACITQLAAALLDDSDVSSQFEATKVNIQQLTSINLCKGCQKDLQGIILRTCAACQHVYHHMCQVADETGCLCNDCFSCPDEVQAAISSQASTTTYMRPATTFSSYIIPDRPISAAASKVTGLMVANGQLLQFGLPVQSADRNLVLQQFLHWIKQLSVGRVTLVAHNCFNFDLPILMNELRRADLSAELNDCVSGFADALPAFRQHAKERLKVFTLESIAKEFLPASQFALHNAVNDVAVLVRLLREKHLPLDALQNHSKPLDAAVQDIDANSKQKAALEELKHRLGEGGKISAAMVQKIASSGLSYKHLLLAHKRSGRDGLIAVLTEKFNGKPRITKNKKVLAKISAHLEKLKAHSLSKCLWRHPFFGFILKRHS